MYLYIVTKIFYYSHTKGSIGNGSPKTGGCYIQVYTLLITMKCTMKGNLNEATLYKLFLNRGGH